MAAIPQDSSFRLIVAVCHTWYIVPFGQGNVRMVDLKGGPLESFVAADGRAPTLTPPPLPPGTPFCSPRGGGFKDLSQQWLIATLTVAGR
jgi:hypothetical protein